MKRATWILLAPLLLGCWDRVGAQPPRALADAGKLDEAIAAARAGGPAMAATLGEILVMRGRLAQADSVLRDVESRQAPGWRVATVALAELSERRGDHAEAARRAQRITGAYEGGASGWTSEDKVAAGRAYLLLQ